MKMNTLKILRIPRLCECHVNLFANGRMGAIYAILHPDGQPSRDLPHGTSVRPLATLRHQIYLVTGAVFWRFQDYIDRDTSLKPLDYEQENQKQHLDGGDSHYQPRNVNDGLQQ